MAILLYPFYLIVFWYKDVVLGLAGFFVVFNRYISSLLSLHLLTSTFFKPLKNEYRKGLVVFSIISGMVVKMILIPAILLILAFFLFIEALFLIGLSVFPFAVFYVALNGYELL